MPIYMKYEGIKGSVTGKGEHNGWIELESAQMGANRTGTGGGMGTNREASRVSVSEITVTKQQDDSSPLLFQETVTGKGRKVTIDFVRINKGKEEVYMSIELENVMISSYHVSGRGGENTAKPMESLSLNFTKIAHSVKPTASDPPGNQDRVGWDLATQ